MPISSFFSLNTALRGLMAHQRALDTTGHNIANASTPGYTRQEAVLSASPALVLAAGAVQSGAGAQLGTGVDVLAFRRVRDQFLDLQLRGQSTRLGEQSARTRSLDQAELALAEPGENGIAAQLGRFWSAWGDLANSPENPAARQAVVDRATTLAGAIQALDAQLSGVSTQAAAEVASLTAVNGRVDSITKEIGQLNLVIRGATVSGQAPNDLMDRRDLLLDQLSELGRVSTVDLGSGDIRVFFGDAALPVVDRPTVTWPQALTAPGGTIGTLMDIASPTGTVAAYRTDLRTVATQLASSVNALHTPPAFFTVTAGNEAATIAVAVTAATLRATVTAAAGANDIALGIAALRSAAADQAYTTLVGRIGEDLRSTTRQEANSQVLLNAVTDRREAVGGVSMDEEMANLVRFQRGYQASARAMTTIDEMIDQLINRTGRVGL